VTGSPDILHHGAVDGVTGSCHELVLDSRTSVLVDCGLFQGAEASPDGARSGRLGIDFDISRVRALLVTHCHIDHVGRIPYLLAAGFGGPILCTEPTAVLLPLILEDALRMGVTRDRRSIERALKTVRDRTVAVPYGRWVPVPQARTRGGHPLEVRFQPAGHILGSAYVECRVHDGVNGRDGPLAVKGSVAQPAVTGRDAPPPAKDRALPVTILFSGDLGGPFTPLLPSPKPPFGADVLVLESTYGDRLHEDRRNRRERLKALVERCVRNRGAVLIPAFSIGRTQELLYELEEIVHRYRRSPAPEPVPDQTPPSARRPRREDVGAGRASHGGAEQVGAGRAARSPLDWSELPIIVDSPLAARFNQAYLALRGYWDAEAKRVLRKGRHPLSFEQVVAVDRHEDHLKVVRHLAETARPAIVIAGSGMCAGGRIVDYLKALLGDPRTDVVFVGYQAEGTPGRAIQEYGPKGGWVDLDGERVEIRAGVHTLPGYSAHGDQSALVGFVRRMRRKPREIRLVHGSEPAKQTLRDRLAQACPDARVWVP
jgi:metallo-beta-lactamase family protein